MTKLFIAKFFAGLFTLFAILVVARDVLPSRKGGDSQDV